MEMAVSRSPDDVSSLGTVSQVADRSQTTLSRDRCPLLLKLGGLKSDRAGVLDIYAVNVQTVVALPVLPYIGPAGTEVEALSGTAGE